MDNAILVELDESLKDHGFTEEKVKDRLTIHFQKASNGGGDVEKVLYPLLSASPSKAIVVFSDKCNIRRLTAYEHRVKFTDKEAIMVRVTVEPLPQVFNNIRVEVNSFYMNLLPRDQTDIFRHRMSPQTKVMCPDNDGGLSLQVQNVDDLQQATNLLFNAIGLDRHQQAGERQETNIVDEEEQHLSIRQRMVNSSPQRGQSKPQQKKIAAVFSGDDGKNESSFSKSTKKDTQTDRGLMSGDRNAQSTNRSARDRMETDGAKSEELTNARPDRNSYQKDGAKSEEFSYASSDRSSYQKDGTKSEEFTYAQPVRNSYPKDGAKSEEFTYARSDRNSQRDGAKSQDDIYSQSTSQSNRDSTWNDQAMMPTDEDIDLQPTGQYDKDSKRKYHDVSHRDMVANSAQKQSGPFSVNPLLYLYLVKKHGDEIGRIEKQHEVIIDKVRQVDSNNDLMGIAGVNKKVSMEHLIQAEDEFIDFYQRYFEMCSVRKLALHDRVPAERLRKASNRISYDFPGILINTHIEDEVAFVGKTDEVSQALDVFRKEAGLNVARSRRLKDKAVDESSETVNGTDYVLGENSYKGVDIKYLQSGARPRTNPQHHNQWPNTSTGVETDNSFRTDGGVEILVEQKDITSQAADIIVNASNGSLQHSGGVAKAISDAAGPKLQEECDNIRRKDYNYKSIAVGECVVTKGYKLPCTYVIHVVGPEFYKRQSMEGFHLELQTTFVTCLTEANRQSNVSAIAIPLVSSGVVGGPKDICASALVDALLQCFDRPGSNIQKVFLVNKDIDATKALKEALKRKIDTNDTQPMEVDSDEGHSRVQTDPYPVDVNPDKSNSKENIINGWKYPKHPTSGTERKSFQSTTGLRIIVAQDHLQNCNGVDVIVNVSSDAYFQTGLAQVIADAAGHSLVQEYRDKSSTQPFPVDGQVVITSGHRLGCAKVMHVLIPKGYTGASRMAIFNKVRDAVLKCLNYAEFTLKYQELMIPIGNYDGGETTPELYAEAIADALKYFSIVRAQNLKRVHVVHPNAEIYMAIQSAIEEYFESDVKNDAHYRVSSKVARADQRTASLNKDDSESKRSRKPSDDDDWGSTKDMKGDTSDDEDEEEKKCPICLEDFKGRSDLKTLDACKHKFCKECIDKAMAVKPVCPMCGKVYGVMKGHQPDGTMRDSTSNYPDLPGYPGCGCITIHYNFTSGKQGKNHPNPGRHYTGASRTAYLPNNTEGRKVLALLKKAFNARLTFTIGTSVTTGATDVVTWNDIHHKTSTSGGTQSFGYPDETYLKRVTEELAAKGIK